MKKYKYKAGVTLVEMLVTVSIIAILATMVIAIATRVDNQGKEQLTRGTFAIIDTALEQFKDHRYPYYGQYYRFDFPLDCNGYSRDEVRATLKDALNASDVQIPVSIENYDLNYSGISVMHLLLSQLTECKKTLEKIDKSLVTNEYSGGSLNVSIAIGDTTSFPFYRIVDPWKTPLMYDYYNENLHPTTPTGFDNMKNSRKNFPVLISAGPDRRFGTSDDIRSR